MERAKFRRRNKSGGRDERRSGGRDGRRSGGFGRGRGRSGGRDSRRPEMHTVVCDGCGSNCEVPFKPTGDKPVYCSDCFKQREGSDRRSGRSEMSAEQFNQLNEKLDKIMEFLQTLGMEPKEVVEEKPKKATKTKAKPKKK